ncbi:MAG: hypothetical protein HYV09_10220 [Deltaproteobacteria bacterium]|nr:hypothetical protein [Deltaproteobacteria bacterium]
METTSTQFEQPLDPGGGVMRNEPNGPELPVPALEDLVAQKLIAAREKDALDVLLVAASADFDRQRLALSIEARDVEVAVRRGLFELFGTARSGRLAQLWRERTGEVLAEDMLARAPPRPTRSTSRLQDWFGVSP